MVGRKAGRSMVKQQGSGGPRSAQAQAPEPLTNSQARHLNPEYTPARPACRPSRRTEDRVKAEHLEGVDQLARADLGPRWQAHGLTDSHAHSRSHLRDDQPPSLLLGLCRSSKAAQRQRQYVLGGAD